MEIEIPLDFQFMASFLLLHTKLSQFNFTGSLCRKEQSQSFKTNYFQPSWKCGSSFQRSPWIPFYTFLLSFIWYWFREVFNLWYDTYRNECITGTNFNIYKKIIFRRMQKGRSTFPSVCTAFQMAENCTGATSITIYPYPWHLNKFTN